MTDFPSSVLNNSSCKVSIKQLMKNIYCTYFSYCTYCLFFFKYIRHYTSCLKCLSTDVSEFRGPSGVRCCEFKCTERSGLGTFSGRMRESRWRGERGCSSSRAGVGTYVCVYYEYAYVFLWTFSPFL